MAVSLTFSNCFVAYADLTVDGDGNFVTTTPTPPLPTDYDPVPKGLRFLDELLMRAYKPGITGAADVIQDTWNKYFGNDEEKAKEAIKINGDFMYFNGDFINQLNVALQDKVHAMDGFYIIEPLNKNSPDEIAKKHNFDSGSDNYKKIVDSFKSARLVTSYNSNVCDDQYIYYQDFYFYLKYGGSRYEALSYDPSGGPWVMAGNGASGKGAWLSINYSVVSL